VRNKLQIFTKLSLAAGIHPDLLGELITLPVAKLWGGTIKEQKGREWEEKNEIVDRMGRKRGKWRNSAYATVDIIYTVAFV